MNQKKIKTENILIDKESYKYLVIYLINYVSSKFMKMLSLYYHEIMGKIEELKQKKYLMVDDYMVNEVIE